MITLFQFPSYWNLPSGSPFCIKLETYLKLTKIPYQVKLPFIKDGDKSIADTSLIIDYLKKTYGDKLDQNLTLEQKAIMTSVQRLCEDHLYWIIMYERWIPDYGWNVVKPVFFGKLSGPIKWFLPNLIRKNIKKACFNHGIGRFTDEERLQLGKQDLDSIATLLGSKPYFFGDSPTSLDASIWGFLTGLLNTPIPSKIREYATQIPVLVDYDKRMQKLF
jgi:glutathione S-transferase